MISLLRSSDQHRPNITASYPLGAESTTMSGADQQLPLGIVNSTMFGNETIPSLIIQSTSTIVAEIMQTSTSLAAATEGTPPEFLGLGLNIWITILCIVCGTILLGILFLAICCLCCTHSSEEEKKKNAAEMAAASRTRRNSGSAVPVATETLIEKHTNHLPDGRQITTISSVRTTTSSNGSKNRKTSRVHLLSQKSSKHRRHHRRHRENGQDQAVAASARQQLPPPPPSSSSRVPSSRRHLPQQQDSQLPIQRVKTPRTDYTVVEMDPTTSAQQPPSSFQNQSSRRAAPQQPSSSSANYDVEMPTQNFPY